MEYWVGPGITAELQALGLLLWCWRLNDGFSYKPEPEHPKYKKIIN